MRISTVGKWAGLVACCLLCLSRETSAQTFFGTNQPGTFQDYPITVYPGATNVAITVAGSSTIFSHLLIKAGGTPSDTSYDFIAMANGRANSINLEFPELSITNYVIRVRTPTNSLAHNFTLAVVTNVNDLRIVRPATKPMVSTNTGNVGPGVWHYFRVEIPTNISGWRISLASTNTGPDLYVQRDVVPITSSWLKRSQGGTNDVVAFAPDEITPGPYLIGVFEQFGSAAYTLRTEFITFTTLTWDPGLTHLGTQVYTNQSTNSGDYYFKITTQNTSLGAWRTALNVQSGDANIYLAKGAPPTLTSNLFKSERIGSDGFVVGSSSFSAGEDWYYVVHVETNAQWNLVSGEAFVTDLGTVAGDGSSGSGSVNIGAEGLRFFKTTVPANSIAWRLWLNGSTNSILVKKGAVPIPGSSDLSQNGQMLVVPTYLVGGLLYFVGVPGIPGATINLDSRQQTIVDLPFSAVTNLNVSGYGYATFRIQVPVDEIAWQVGVFPSSGNPNVAVRRNQVPNENNNDAYSEVPGAVTDSILLVPPTLSDGTFYVTVYGTNSYSGSLQSGAPEITDINFVSTTLNTDTNRVGWRLFKVSDIGSQVGALGWDLFVTNFTPGTKIALRRNAAPGIWTYRNPSPITAGQYDFLSAGDFLQRPGHQADVWYVGVYNPSNALGAFTLVTRALTAEPMTFTGGSAARVSVPANKWQFFRIDVPTNILGWDIRVTDVTAGSPQLVVRRELLPVSLLDIGTGFSGVISLTNWTPTNQWSAASDWTGRDLSSDGTANEYGRILTMGFHRPLEAGTYYVGVLGGGSSTTPMSYTVLSRGIGPGLDIPVQDIPYIGSATNVGLAPRDIAVYRVTISNNVPSWKLKLMPTSGEAMMAVAKDRIPNITATVLGSVTNDQTAGKRMTRGGNEHHVQLPLAWETNIVTGQYYILVASEGNVDSGNTTRIGTGSSDYVLQSVGPMPEVDLGLLDTPDIVYTSQLEGGESAALHFHNDPATLGFELTLEDTTGNPHMVSRPTIDLADPGIQFPPLGIPVDPYGNEGGQQSFLAVSPDTIEVSDPFIDETVMVKARGSGSVYPDANYTLRIKKYVAPDLAFDGGVATVTAQTNNYQFFRVDVPADALGWDVRITDVGAGSPQLIIGHDALTFYYLTTWNPGVASYWPIYTPWVADLDWTQRQYSSDGNTDESGRILAMGMGRPLEPGTYYVGIRNVNAPNPASYTIRSRGIGSPYSIPVIDLPFAGGSFSNTLPAREAAYYRIVLPSDAASWQAKLTTLSGEAMLVGLSNSIPSVVSGQSPNFGKLMQKPGNEHYVIVAPNSFSSFLPATNYFAVVSEGLAVTNYPTRIGPGNTSFIMESRGEFQPVDLGVIGNDPTNHTGALEGGEVRAYQFTVPDGTVSLEARLQNVTGNPAMVLRVGSLYASPGAATPGGGSGSVGTDAYGNEGGQNITAANGGANSILITMANPSNSVYTVLVKARPNGAVYPPATYTLSVRALSYTTVDFDGGAVVITNHASATWQYFRVDVPTNALGWDVRLANVVSGLPRLVVRRDLLPTSLMTTPWANPGIQTSWPSSNQWAASADWTRRTSSADNLIVEDGRILAVGMGEPLEPGTYYIGVINNTGTNIMSYTFLSRGIGDNMALPVADLAYNGGSLTNTLPPREAAYYRVNVPSNSPTWKLKLSPSVGEAMVVLLKGRVPNVDAGRITSPISGKFMQKAGDEHYVLVPVQTTIAAGTYYIGVVSEGLNPASALRIGTGTSSYNITSLGDTPPVNLGTVSPIDLVNSNSLEGGESRTYQFTVPPSALAVEVRLENRVGNPVLSFSTNAYLPDPGGVMTGQREAYGNDGGVNPGDVNSNIVTLANSAPGIYSVAVKARPFGTVYPDAGYVLRVRQVPVPELNFTPEFNTNGLNNVGSGLLLDAQRAYYKVVVPSNVWNKPVIGWQLDVSQVSGIAAVRVRKDLLPSDTVAGMPSTANQAIIAPPFLTNGTWYVEVRGTNSTSFTLTSSSLALQRPTWIMPGIGEPTVTPGLTEPEFGDSGLDTNGVPFVGDQGIDLEQGHSHYYAVTVPTNNAGLMRAQLDAISGNSDLYMRLNDVPTFSHKTNGTAGTTLDRTVTGTTTSYANWVPLNGAIESRLTPGTWYLAVRAATNANARYRLRLSTGNVQDLDFYTGVVTNQTVAGGDWKYYRVQVPTNPPTTWNVTFYQQAGDVVLHLRDTVPPGNGVTIGSLDYKDWTTDAKNTGPYGNFDAAGTYGFGVPPIRPGSVYYLGIRAKGDSTFAVTSSTSGTTNPPLPIIAFYGGSVTNLIPVGGWVGYRIFSPYDALRWRHTSIHSNTVGVYIENGSMPTRTPTDDFRSSGANSTQDKFMTNYPWAPNQVYYLVATNTSAVPQPFSFTMNGSSTSADDDADGMPDIWELQYFGSLSPTAGADFDGDGVSNLNEYQEGTHPADRTSFRPRLNILSTNGVVNVSPPGTNFVMGTSVTLTAVPNAGYNFISWGGAVTGSVNPSILVMNTNKTVVPKFRVPGDDFDQRAPLAGYSASHSGYQNVGATKETGEPNHAGTSGGKSLWWTWTAPVSGTVSLNTAGTDFRNALAIYTGSAVSGLTPVASNLAGVGTNTSQLTFNATAGTTYQIAVDGFSGASGTVTVNLTMPDAIVLSNPLQQGDGSFQFTLLSAPGLVLRVDATTNFLGWDPIVTITNVSGSSMILDPQATNFRLRFYRAVVP